MKTVGLGRLVSSALDPVLVPAGFLGGQYGDGRGGDLQIIFCAGHEEFSRRHLRLPQAHQQRRPGTCVDLVVDVCADGTLFRLDLEETSLRETLSHTGLTADGDLVARTIGCPMVEGLPVIEGALRRLFAETD